MDYRATGLVLAGGRGKRMGVLCHSRPKPALPYAGGYRVVDFALSNCIHSGIRDIAALVDHRRSEMTRYLRRWFSANLQTGAYSILQPRSECYSGTADAVYQNLDYIDGRAADAVIILAADHVYHMDYRPLLAFHVQKGADATVAVTRVALEQTHRFGTVTTDADGRISEFMEKSTKPASDMASMGIYVFNPRVLAEFLAGDATDESSTHDFGFSLLPELLRKGKLFAYEFRGYWRDIGTVEAYYDSHMDLLGDAPSFAVHGAWPVLGERKTGPRQFTGACGNIVNSLIGAGCRIDGYVENSVLWPGVRVEKRAEVHNSIVMSNTRVGYHSVVHESILDERVSIPEFCLVGSGSGPVPIDRRTTVLGTGVTLHEHSAIGSGCVIAHRTRPKSFPGKALYSGNVIASSAGCDHF